MWHEYSLNSDFSWSRQRERLFHFCRLAYLFYYHFSQGGSEASAAADRRHLYRLKRLIYADEWLQGVIIATLKSTFNVHDQPCSPSVAEKEFLRSGRQEFQRSWSRLTGNSTDFFETYYRHIARNTLYDELRRRLLSRLNCFIATAQFREQCTLDPLSRRVLKSPEYCFIGSYKCWLNPALVWRQRDQWHIMLIDTAVTDIEKRFAAALGSALLSKLNRSLPAQQLIIHYEFTADDAAVRYFNGEAILPIRQTIVDCCRSLWNFEQQVAAGSVAVQGLECMLCRQCRFYEFCKNNNFFSCNEQ